MSLLTVSGLGEFPLIHRLSAAFAVGTPAAGAITLGIGDDACVVELPAGHQAVVTADALVEDVHFRRDWSSPADVGWKALAASLSDLGAMGAKPVCAILTLALPGGTPSAWPRALAQGLAECGRRYGCPTTGGDTVTSPSGIHVTITAIGAARPEHIVRRAGAGPGDLLCVTGVIGESAAGLACLRKNRRDREFGPLLDWHRRPAPPCAAGALLAESGAVSSMLDLSDGLASDLRHLANASGVGAVIDLARLPVSDAARRAASALGIDWPEWGLRGGEDYQLLFTTSPQEWPRIPPLLGPLGVTATIIGKITRRGLRVRDAEGRLIPLPAPGFSHFTPAADPPDVS